MIPSAGRPELPPSTRIRRTRVGRIAAMAGLVCAVVLLAAEPGEAQTACGGSGQRACCVTERGFFEASCDGDLVEIGGCSGNCLCGGDNPFSLVSAGTCTTDQFPAACGDLDERACKIFEHIPSCKSGFFELLGVCRRRDGDGFPNHCGGLDERACTLLEHIPSCRGDLAEVPFPGGTCIRPDDDGFPSFCGGAYERPCTAFPLEHIPSCRPMLREEPVDDGSGRVECRAFCGQNGQRPCTIVENFSACASGLSVRADEFGVCGSDPLPSNESDADAPARGQTRTLFFFHGRGGDLNGGAPPETNNLMHLLSTRVPNVRQFYGVDWNNGLDPARKLMTFRFFDEACAQAGTCARTWGTEEFEYRTFEITEVARAAADAIKHLPTEGDITLIGGSFGGVIVRQLVFRHYDELRRAGKRIAEVITMAAPNRGGQAGALEIGGPGLLSGQAGMGADLQSTFACLPNPLGFNVAVGIPQADRGGCQLGAWIDWMDSRERGVDAPPWFIDNRGYPQIRWIAMAGNADRLDVTFVLGLARTLEPVSFLYVDLLEELQDPTVVPFHDSDGTITVRSAFGLDVDECYPFSREDRGVSRPRVEWVSRFYEKSVNGATQIQEALSAVCYHPQARRDPRVLEDAVLTGHDDGYPQELTKVGHSTMFENVIAADFVAAALNIFGDTNGDGVVNGEDLRADAGPDVSLECAGELTPVALDASASVVPASDTISYTWSGPFTSVTGATVVVNLPVGTHTIALDIDDGHGFTGTDEIVVTVGDSTPPVMGTVVGHTIEAAGAGGTPFTLIDGAADVCSAVTVQRSPDLTAYPLGATDVTVTATDASGNSASIAIRVTVVDTTPPEITAPADLGAEANAVLSLLAIGSAMATDIFPVTLSSDAPPAFPLGATLVTWTATDANGNAAVAAHTVTVVDTTPPAITAPADVTAEANAVLSVVDIGSATATDIFPLALTSDAPAAFRLGESVVIWTATDVNNNAATSAHTITVVDTTPPALILPPDVAVTAAGAATAIDTGSAQATDIFGAVVTSDAPALFPIGATLVRWTAVDGNGNRVSMEQKVEAIYGFRGFTGPIQAGGTYKANSTLPLRFSLAFADGTPAPAAAPTLAVAFVGANEGLSSPIELSTIEVPDAGNVFRFTGDDYRFNLHTRGWVAGRYRLTAVLDDGRSYAMEIALK